MDKFDDIVKIVKELFSRGRNIVPRMYILTNDEIEGFTDIVFSDEVSKLIAFSVVLPDMIRALRPTSCIFVLPCRARHIPSGTEEEVVLVHEVDAIKIASVVVKKDGSVQEMNEKAFVPLLLRPVQTAFKEVWEDII